MKTLCLAVAVGLVLLSSAAQAQRTVINPTLPGTSMRDWSKPGVVIEDGKGYQTIPGTSMRDWSKPGFKIEGDTVYPTVPGTSMRDYGKPGYKVEEK